jgi:erythromycin esterase
VESEGFEDLEFLRERLAGARVVQLGESTHGIREYGLLKARIARFLHQEMGFGVLAFESAVYQCHEADRAAGEAPAATTLRRCAYGVWHNEEVLPLFEHLAASRASERPLRLAGIDVQPIGSHKEHRPRFLADRIAPVDSAYAAEVFALDSTFLSVYDRGARERRAWFRSEGGRRMAEAYDRLADFLEERQVEVEAASSEPGAAGVARRTARSTARYVRQQAAPTTREYVELRDEGMAENLAFLLEERFPGEKVIVWAHNFHVRHDNLSIPPDSTMFPDVAARTMGSWIRERYGDRVYTVGLYAHHGRAADNAGELFDIPPAAPGSLEALLHAFGAEALFVDLRAEGLPQALEAPVTARYDGTVPLTMILRDQYDAVLFVDEATPRRPLR